MLGVACCRDVRQCMNSTYIQLRIHYTLQPLGGLVFVCHQVLVLLFQEGVFHLRLKCQQGLPDRSVWYVYLYTVSCQNCAKLLQLLGSTMQVIASRLEFNYPTLLVHRLRILFCASQGSLDVWYLSLAHLKLKTTYVIDSYLKLSHCVTYTLALPTYLYMSG